MNYLKNAFESLKTWFKTMPKGMRILLVAVIVISGLVLISAPAQAQDTWNSPDKALHLGAGAVISTAAMLHFKDQRTAFALGCGAGALKELADKVAGPTKTFSGKDLAVTCIGAALGTAGSSWMLTRQGVVYRAAF